MAIALRRCFHHSGLAKKAVEELFTIANDELKLHKIYLNVISNNNRAKRFYEKVGLEIVGKSRQHIIKEKVYIDLDWYEIILEERK